MTSVSRVVSLLSNTLSRFIIAFLLRSSCLLTSRLQSPFAVILEPKKRKSVTTSTLFLSICHEAMGLDSIILIFLIFGFVFFLISWRIFGFKLAPSLSSFTLIKSFLSSSLLSATRVVSSTHLRLLISHLSWFQLVTHPTHHFSWYAPCIW